MSALTEAEAHEKWCHRVTITEQQGVRARKDNCMGAKCMAWRWAEGDMIDDERMPPGTRLGYCGLAGPLDYFK